MRMSNQSCPPELDNAKGDEDVDANVDMDLFKNNDKLDKSEPHDGQGHKNRTTSQEPTQTVRKQFPTPKEVRINPHDLQYRLSQELHEEERYKLINDAKLRAMTQGTASYEDFRQIWMAAHLRPLEKDDRLKSGSSSKVVWNPMVGKDKPGSSSSNAKTTEEVDEGKVKAEGGEPE